MDNVPDIFSSVLRLKKKDKSGASSDAKNGGSESSPVEKPVFDVDSFPGNGSAVPSLPNGKPVEMQMIIAHGELPNLIQYLSTCSQNTGCLTLYEKDGTVVGRIFFRDGYVYYARNRTSVGVEAVARLIHEANDMPAVFDKTGKIEEKNIEVATSNLLVEAIVRADELLLTEPQLDSSKKTDLIDEFMGQQRVPIRLLSPEEAAAQEQSAPEAWEESGAEPADETASEGVEPEAAASPVARKKKIILAAVIGLLVAVCLGGGAWWVMQLLDRPVVPLQKPVAASPAVRIRPANSNPSTMSKTAAPDPLAVKKYFILDDGNGPGYWGMPCSLAEENLFSRIRASTDRAACRLLVASGRQQGGEYWGGMQWRMAVLRFEAEQRTDAGDDEAPPAEVRWKRARKTLEGVWAAAQSRRMAMYTAYMNRAKVAFAKEFWEDAGRAYEEVLTLPGFARDTAARQGVTESRYRVILAQAEGAMARGDWERVYQEAKLAADLVPGSVRARDLLLQARMAQIPLLTVRVWADDTELKTADITVDGVRQPDAPLPATYRVERDKSYSVTVSVPPSGDRCYAPQQWTHVVDRDGRQIRDLKFSALPKPILGAGWVVPGIRIGMASVPAGSFLMGSEAGKKDEQPAHPVTITCPFWVGRTEVTNGQYRQFVRESGYDGGGNAGTLYLQHLVAKKNRISEMPADDDCPVCYVTWNHAMAFCRWLTTREKTAGRLPTGYQYRLPTEAEWEYACRAGSESDFAGPVAAMAWSALTTPDRRNHPVGRRTPNSWGIFDMHGNVWEWCLDWRQEYSEGAVTDPQGPSEGLFKVVRGGSWENAATMCRSANRGGKAIPEMGPNLGFRIVLGVER